MKRCLLLVFILAFLLSPALFAADEIENLVKGGDFEEDIDMSNWTAFSSGPATMSIVRDKKEAAVGEASVFVEVTGVDPAKTSNPQFRQLPYGTAMSVEKGKTYTLSMSLKAEEPRNIQMMIFREVPSYEVRITKTINVGTEWEEFWVTGAMPEDSLVAIRLLNAGSGKISYWVDNVRFYEGEYVPTFIEEEKAVMMTGDKLPATWAGIRSRY